jgi:hypothetical protein
MRNHAIACIAAALAVLALGCGGGGDSTAAVTTEGTTSPERPSQPASKPRAEETVTPSHCPSGHPACRTTEGRILYVERVDPDGDGDAHFVVVDPQSITLPGLTSIDVRVGLRPHPLPGPGDLISAAGPVQTGSFGQDQIHALELHVAGE